MTNDGEEDLSRVGLFALGAFVGHSGSEQTPLPTGTLEAATLTRTLPIKHLPAHWAWALVYLFSYTWPRLV